MSRRTERLSSIIQQELALIIMRELSDPRLTGLPSITRVTVSDDLSMADIYITSMGTPGQQAAALNALKHSAGMMRTKLTKILSIRQVPFLRFHSDEQLKKEMEVLSLIDKAARESAERERQRAIAAGEIPAEDASDADASEPEASEPDASEDLPARPEHL